MDPLTRSPATLVDLLDRVLDRGLVLNADIIVSLAGVPLIGINLRAALAGMETMTRYGLMRDWDNDIRTRALLPGRAAIRVAGTSLRVPAGAGEGSGEG